MPTDGPTARSPMTGPIDEDGPIDKETKAWYYSAVGCIGWLAHTARPDIKHTFTRLSIFFANPTSSAVKAAKRCWNYLYQSRFWCVYANVGDERQPNGWQFYSDSDYCGSTSTRTKREAMLGLVALLNGMCVVYRSGKATTALAHLKLDFGTTNLSVCASEIYGLAEASTRLLGLSYIAEDFSATISLPMTIRADNAASIVFTKATAHRTKLTQFDCRLQWIKTLRDQKLFDVVYVKSAENLADMFTKILQPIIFERLRSLLMTELPIEMQSKPSK